MPRVVIRPDLPVAAHQQAEAARDEQHDDSHGYTAAAAAARRPTWPRTAGRRRGTTRLTPSIRVIGEKSPSQP